MNINKTHLGAILLGTGVFLGLTGAALVATDKKEVPTMSTDTVE